jgi:hypothetical protein
MMSHHSDVPPASTVMHRRSLLIGATVSLLCAPAVVRASSLMPVKVVEWTRLPLPVSEKPYAGWVERVAYHMMDHVLETGWTPERAASFYGGMSESKMRSMVVYARRHGFLRRAA